MRPPQSVDTSFRVVDSHNERDQFRRLQTQIYLRRGIVDQVPPSGMIEDEHVDISTYLIAERNSVIVGGCRIIPTDPGGLPTVVEFRPEEPWRSVIRGLSPAKVAEVSALAIDSDKRVTQFAVSAGLFRAIFHHLLMDTTIRVLLGAVEIPLLRIVNRAFGIPLNLIAEPHWWLGAVRAPLLIDMVGYMASARHDDPAAYDYFTDGLIIDVRSDEAAISVRSTDQFGDLDQLLGREGMRQSGRGTSHS
jgi:hypothetical protein